MSGGALTSGRLLIIGGGEDREDDKAVLDTFVDLCGGANSNIVVITAASKIGEKVYEIYDAAFRALGVTDHSPVHIETRPSANDPATAQRIAAADGIFITGGDQKRLLSLIGGTAIDTAIRAALSRGAVLAGTSAGASAMSAHMLAYGRPGTVPEKGTIGMGAGLGLLQHIIIDQHFSERHRLTRLLTLVGQNPQLLGVGIDEDTALLIECGKAIEVFGSGTVTVVDGRDMVSNMLDIARREVPEMIDIRMHIFPAGTRHELDAADPGRTQSMSDFLNIVTTVT